MAIQYTTDQVEDVLRFQHKRVVTNLFRSFLTLMENLEDEHDDAMGRLYDALPADYKEYVKLIDYWSDTRSAAIRKQILDSGNDTLRNLDDMLSNYEIKLKQPK